MTAADAGVANSDAPNHSTVTPTTTPSTQRRIRSAHQAADGRRRTQAARRATRPAATSSSVYCCLVTVDSSGELHGCPCDRGTAEISRKREKGDSERSGAAPEASSSPGQARLRSSPGTSAPTHQSRLGLRPAVQPSGGPWRQPAVGMLHSRRRLDQPPRRLSSTGPELPRRGRLRLTPEPDAVEQTGAWRAGAKWPFCDARVQCPKNATSQSGWPLSTNAFPHHSTPRATRHRGSPYTCRTVDTSDVTMGAFERCTDDAHEREPTARRSETHGCPGTTNNRYKVSRSKSDTSRAPLGTGVS